MTNKLTPEAHLLHTQTFRAIVIAMQNEVDRLTQRMSLYETAPLGWMWGDCGALLGGAVGALSGEIDLYSETFLNSRLQRRFWLPAEAELAAGPKNPAVVELSLMELYERAVQDKIWVLELALARVDAWVAWLECPGPRALWTASRPTLSALFEALKAEQELFLRTVALEPSGSRRVA